MKEKYFFPLSVFIAATIEEGGVPIFSACNLVVIHQQLVKKKKKKEKRIT
jgi:hypothetical protein